MLLLGFWFLKLHFFFVCVCWCIDILTCIEVWLWIDQTKLSHIFISVRNLNLNRYSVLFDFVIWYLENSFLMIENEIMRIKRKICILQILHLDYEERKSETSRCNYVMDKIKITLNLLSAQSDLTNFELSAINIV